MEKKPLSKGSSIEVYNPSLDFFLKKIEAENYFSFAKQLHGFWDDILAAMIVEPTLRKIQYDDDYLLKLSAVMVKVKNARSRLRYTIPLYFDILKMTLQLNQAPNNFYFGVSDVDFYPHKEPPYSINSYIPTYNNFKLLKTNNCLKCREMRCGDRQLMIKSFLPKNYTPFNGIIWRRFSYNGELESFFEKTKQKHSIIIVGPEYFKDFGTLLEIPDYHHIPIHGVAASEKKEQLLDTILQHHKLLNNKPAIYFFVAGVLSIWLIHQLHDKVSNSFLIDAGQALDAVIPANNMKITTEFQLLNYKRGKNFKPYKTANPNYFVEKQVGDRIIINAQKEVVFLDKKQNPMSCYFSCLQTKSLHFLYFKTKLFKYADIPLTSTLIRIVRHINFLLKSK